MIAALLLRRDGAGQPARAGAHTFFHDMGSRERLKELREDGCRQGLMRFFPASQDDFHAYFVSFREEFLRLFLLEFAIVVVGFQPEADTFHFHFLLMLLALFFLLCLFVLILSVIEDPADRRHGTGGYFHKIKAGQS